MLAAVTTVVMGGYGDGLVAHPRDRPTGPEKDATTILPYL